MFRKIRRTFGLNNLFGVPCAVARRKDQPLVSIERTEDAVRHGVPPKMTLRCGSNHVGHFLVVNRESFQRAFQGLSCRTNLFRRLSFGRAIGGLTKKDSVGVPEVPAIGLGYNLFEPDDGEILDNCKMFGQCLQSTRLRKKF